MSVEIDFSDCKELVCCMCGRDDQFIITPKRGHEEFPKLITGFCHICHDHSILTSLEEFTNIHYYENSGENIK